MVAVLIVLYDVAGYKFVWVDGQRNRAQRAAAVRLFMQPESDAFLFVSTTRAGGTGTNLQVRPSTSFLPRPRGGGASEAHWRDALCLNCGRAPTG